MADTQKDVMNEGTEKLGKQENDRSYRRDSKDESGMGSTLTSNGSQGCTDGENTGATSGYDSLERSAKTSWEEYEGEVVNLSLFKLSILQSSNVGKRLDECEISSIEHVGGTPRLRKGYYRVSLLNILEEIE